MDTVIRIVADGGLIIIVLIGTIALLMGVKHQNKLRDYAYGIMAGLSALFIAKIMSLLYQPAIARPFLEQGVTPGALYIDNPGFPSDHALLAGVVVVAVAVLTPYRKLTVVLLLITVLMSAGRVAALVHTPVDIAGGLLAAVLGGVWYMARKHQFR